MLDRDDKQWIAEILDEKLNKTTTILRTEMQEGNEALREDLRSEMREMNEALREDLRGEMREMNEALREDLRCEIQETAAELRTEMRGMKDEISTNVVKQISEDFIEGLRTQCMTVFENTYQYYLKLMGENIPDKIRSYDRIDKVQNQQHEEIGILKGIAGDHENRIVRLEKNPT